MHLHRKYSIGTFFIGIVVFYLLVPLSLTCSKNGLIEDIPLNGIASLSPKSLHIFPAGLFNPKLAQKGEKDRHSDFEIFLSKIRSILPEDKIAKLMLLENTAESSVGRALCLSRSFRQFRFPLADQSPSPGFQLSYSGLSPPSV